jgi:hypothetical protein
MGGLGRAANVVGAARPSAQTFRDKEYSSSRGMTVN